MNDTTPGTPAGNEPAHSAFRVLAALADLGEATAAAIAQHAGLAYSTVTPKLRAWETSGHAQKYRHAATNQTLWRLTPAGRAATGAQSEDPAPPTDTDVSQTADDAHRPTASPPAAQAPSDVPPAEPDTNPPHTDVRHDDEPPLPEIAAAQPVPNPLDAAADADPQPAKRKRPAGALEASVLAILHHRRDETFTVNDLRKLVDKADEGTGYPAASAGALANALTKLTGKGRADTVQERPATYQAAPTTD